ncbi:hypothetical protein AZE42_10310 [Rhizopogon vesiculosus]|uniref:Uncharacterized protein n=1 Tax=Rhizopogon vesiculosus TaxID=180088 RepID=A0A1J8QBL7_9AGAM|nr:hypothetical protein AZE42_10310 [Rhizopogon vesiculosus]
MVFWQLEESWTISWVSLRARREEYSCSSKIIERGVDAFVLLPLCCLN